MWATLKQDIVAYESGDESATKFFEVGSKIDVEDSDEDWFTFYPADDDIPYDSNERPDDVLIWDDETEQERVAEVGVYNPVPNMTPLSRRHLLL